MGASLFMYHSNGSVMHTRIRACFLYFFYNPYKSLFNSLVSTFFNLHSAYFMNNDYYLYTCIYMSMILCRHNIIAALAIPTCSKYTSKEGLELLRLLTMELCFVNVLQDLGVLCATWTTYHIT